MINIKKWRNTWGTKTGSNTHFQSFSDGQKKLFLEDASHIGLNSGLEHSNPGSTFIDWQRSGIHVDNLFVRPKDDIHLSRSISTVTTNPLIHDYIYNNAHQQGFLTRAQNQLYYGCAIQSKIGASFSNRSYHFQKSHDDVKFTETFEINKIKVIAPESDFEEHHLTFKPEKKMPIARVTAVSKISVIDITNEDENIILNENNEPKQTVKHEIVEYKIEVFDKKLATYLLQPDLNKQPLMRKAQERMDSENKENKQLKLGK